MLLAKLLNSMLFFAHAERQKLFESTNQPVYSKMWVEITPQKICFKKRMP